MQVLDVVLGDPALGADLVDEPSDEPHHGVSDVAVLRVFESALRIEAFCDAAGDAVKHNVNGRYVIYLIILIPERCLTTLT